MALARLIWAVLLRLREEQALALALAALGAALAGVQVAEAILFGRVVNALVTEQSALLEIAIWASVSLCGIGASVALALYADRLSHRRRLTTLSEALMHALQQPAKEFRSQGAGELIRNIIVGTDGFFWLWLSAFREVGPALAAIVILFPIAIIISPLMSVTLVVLSVAYVAANAAIVTRTQAGQEVVDSYHRSLSNRINDVLANASVVHAFTRLHQEIDSLRAMTDTILRMQYPVLNWWAVLSVFTRASATVSLVSVFLVGSWMVGRGALTIGDVVTFAGFAGLLIARLDQAAGAVGRLFPIAFAMRGLLALLRDDPYYAEDSKKPDLRVSSGHVEFRHVSFTFPGTGIGLREITMDVPPGATIAIVGPTGSGKSTLISLLQRIFDPDQGMIVIDAQNIVDHNAASVRASIAMVAQEAGLFNRSIADNLRVARPNASDDELLGALERAQLSGFLAQKTEGLGFEIGERGQRLSGGERQRLSIAQAILKNAPILILDEATSALDVKTEEAVQKAIVEVSAGRTTFVIAHRLSTIRNADEIIVLNEGRIIERGGYRQLAAAGGLFAELQRASLEPIRPTLEEELDKLNRP